MTDSKLVFAPKDGLLTNSPEVRSDNEDATWNKRPMTGEDKTEPYTRKGRGFEQTSESNKFKGYNMCIVIQRDKDKLSLAEWVVEGHGRAVKASGLFICCVCQSRSAGDIRSPK